MQLAGHLKSTSCCQFCGKAHCFLFTSGSYGQMLECWMLAGMVAVCEQWYYWMLKVSCYVVSSVTEWSKCLATMGPTLGGNFV